MGVKTGFSLEVKSGVSVEVKSAVSVEVKSGVNTDIKTGVKLKVRQDKSQCGGQALGQDSARMRKFCIIVLQ